MSLQSFAALSLRLRTATTKCRWLARIRSRCLMRAVRHLSLFLRACVSTRASFHMHTPTYRLKRSVSCVMWTRGATGVCACGENVRRVRYSVHAPCKHKHVSRGMGRGGGFGGEREREDRQTDRAERQKETERDRDSHRDACMHACRQLRIDLRTHDLIDTCTSWQVIRIQRRVETVKMFLKFIKVALAVFPTLAACGQHCALIPT